VINVVDVIIGSGILILLFLVLWLNECLYLRNEYIPYGLRSSEDQTANYKTNITELETGFIATMFKFEGIGEVSKNQ
jgi:hypothetical protein